MKKVIISYVPMLIKSPEEIAKLSEGANRGEVESILSEVERLSDRFWTKAVIWTGNKKTQEINPSFLIPSAQLVLEHLLDWCQHRPQEWFTLIWESDIPKGGYSVYLLPDLRKSRLRHYHIFNKVPPQKEEVMVIFHCLGTFVTNVNAFKPEFIQARDTVDLGFIPDTVIGPDIEEKIQKMEIPRIKVKCKRLRELPVAEQQYYREFMLSKI